MDRLVEGHGVDGDRDALTLRVTHGRDGAGFVNELHDQAAMHVAERVGVFGQH